MAGEGTREQEARAKQQRARSLAIALSLGFMAILFYVATIVRLGPNAIRPSEFRPPAQQAATPADAPAADAEACKKAGTC